MNNIRNFRKKARISQKELAQKIGVTQQAVTRWEKGDASPRINSAKKLADFFECSIDDLFNR